MRKELTSEQARNTELHDRVLQLQGEEAEMRVRLVALDQLPFNIQARNHTGGRFSAYPWQGVVAIMAQLARCTPPSAVPSILCDAAHLLAPGMPFRE